MSFEPDTNDIRVRQLGEEIKRIREEQFAKAFPVGLGGGSSPVGGDAVTGGSSTGTFAWLPNMVRVTRDTGVVERLAYKDKNVNRDFFIGDIVDGSTSGATGEIGDIDITGTDTGFLIFVPGTTSGTFIDNEFLNATTDGNNVARADLSLGNPVGRGHLNAGSASIIAEATESPAEIHFIDTALQNGQFALIRAQNGQTIRMRRAVTNDGNTGNLDLDESFDITENALVFFQFQAQSNVTPDGGWVPLITDVTTAVSGGAGGGINFPILYPQTNIGSVGLQTVALDLNNSNGHYQLMTLTGDISLAFVNETSIGVGFKFYAVLAQDAVGGHALISVPSSVKNGSSLVTQLDPTPLTQTLFQFTTADGGTTYHAQVVSPSSAGQNQTPWLSNIDASTFDLFNADKIIFFGAGGFSFPVDASLQAISTSGTGLQFNVGISQTYRFFRGGIEAVQIGDPNTGVPDTSFFDNSLRDVGAIFFTDSPSFTGTIFSNPAFAELAYNVGGVGSHHSFYANNALNASFEIRELVNKSNVNFDLVTNNMINTDQILFIDSQGFNNATDHGERRLTGGALGISMNLPVESPFPSAFAIWFEEDALDRSNPYYQFTRQALIMGTGVGDCTRAPVVTGAIQYQLCRGGGLFDLGTRTSLRSSTVSSVPSMEQILELVAGADKKVEFLNTEDGPAGIGGGMKMFTDLNMQTHNINRIDVATWIPDVGTGIAGLGNNAYGIVADDTKSLTLGTVPAGVNRPLFLFHAPQDQVVTTNDPAFGWAKRHIVFATLDEGEFHLFANNTNLKPVVIGDGGFRYGLAYQPVDNPFIDGESRLINNAGSLDVVYRTGGNLVNLSDLTAGAGGGKDLDNDLGDVSGAVAIDWNVSNFHRMRLIGDVTIIMINLPDSPDWQEITVEFLEDPTGGHSVTFLDIFRNTPLPVIREGANRYTIVKFYSYFDSFDNILTWQPEYLTNSESAQGSINQGMIHVKLNTDQQSDLGVNNHIEWRTILFTNNMTVSSGVGQLAGIFSGFRTARTYELTGVLGVDKTIAGSGSISYQWYDIANAQFIGTQGTAQDPSEDNPYQPTAKAFFQPFDTSDTVELRIISQTGNPIDTIYSGFPSGQTNDQTPESFAEIKDCGQTQSQFNASQEELLNEDTILLPSNPPFIFNCNSTINTQYQRRNPYSNVAGTIADAEVIIPFQHGTPIIFSTTITEFGGPFNKPIQPTGQFTAGTFGLIKKVRVDIAENTLNKAININFFKNGSQLGTILTIGAGQTGSASSTGSTPIVAGDTWAYSFQTTDELIPSGVMTWAFSTDIEWGVTS